MWNHMGEYGSHWGWGWMIFGGLHMLLFWLLVIGVVVLLVRLGSGANNRGRSERDPLAILKERYARGEIDKSQYEQMRKDLER